MYGMLVFEPCHSGLSGSTQLSPSCFTRSDSVIATDAHDSSSLSVATPDFITRSVAASTSESLKNKKGFIEYTSTRPRVPAHTRDSQDRLHPA
jgi:hypothetical protein